MKRKKKEQALVVSEGFLSERDISTERNYCEYCGSLLETRIVGAEQYCRATVYPWSIPYPRYNARTGARNYATEYSCPNESIWDILFKSSRHSEFGRTEESLYY